MKLIIISDYFDEKTRENPDFAYEIPVPIYELRTRLMSLADNLLQKSVNLSVIRPEDMGVSAVRYIPYFNEMIEHVVIPAESAYSEELNVRNDLDLNETIIRFGKVLDKRQTHIKDLRLRYLFIDEFQDTDDVQIEISASFIKDFLGSKNLGFIGRLAHLKFCLPGRLFLYPLSIKQ